MAGGGDPRRSQGGGRAVAAPMGGQLPLGLRTRAPRTFASFVEGADGEALAWLSATAGRAFGFLWGARSTGKTHLLQAACQAVAEWGGRVAYLPLADEPGLGPPLLEGLGALDLVCVDDLHVAAGEAAWERALFTLYNELQVYGAGLVCAADRPPGRLGIQLPDLASRLSWGPVFHLRGLDDEALGAALQRRAWALGMTLSDDVVGYLLRRERRDAAALFGLLERLERASLSAQRRLTIPFVREVLGGEGLAAARA